MSKILLFKFDEGLLNAKIIKRPSAQCKTPYVADIIYKNNDETINTLAHTPALGCCGLTDKDSEVLISRKKNPKVCSHCVEISIMYEKGNKILIGCNPKMAENLVEECIKKNVITSLSHVKSYKREQKFMNSRFDFCGVDSNGCDFILEVKNVPLANYEDVTEKELKKMDFTDRCYDSKVAYFPDGYRKKKSDVVSPRALKHIQELEKIKIEKKHEIRCILCFVIQRNDISSFQASNLDPTYKEALKSAYNNGVEVLPIIIEWTKKGEAYFIDKEIIFYID